QENDRPAPEATALEMFQRRIREERVSAAVLHVVEEDLGRGEIAQDVKDGECAPVPERDPRTAKEEEEQATEQQYGPQLNDGVGRDAHDDRQHDVYPGQRAGAKPLLAPGFACSCEVASGSCLTPPWPRGT